MAVLSAMADLSRRSQTSRVQLQLADFILSCVSGLSTAWQIQSMAVSSRPADLSSHFIKAGKRFINNGRFIKANGRFIKADGRFIRPAPHL